MGCYSVSSLLSGIYLCVSVCMCVSVHTEPEHVLCCEGLHLNRLPPSVGDGMLLILTINWWLACNLGNSRLEGGEKKAFFFRKVQKSGFG